MADDFLTNGSIPTPRIMRMKNKSMTMHASETTIKSHLHLWSTSSKQECARKINCLESTFLLNAKLVRYVFIWNEYISKLWFNQTCRTCHHPWNLPLLPLAQGQQPLRRLQPQQQQELLQQMQKGRPRKPSFVQPP